MSPRNMQAVSWQSRMIFDRCPNGPDENKRYDDPTAIPVPRKVREWAKRSVAAIDPPIPAGGSPAPEAAQWGPEPWRLGGCRTRLCGGGNLRGRGSPLAARHTCGAWRLRCLSRESKWRGKAETEIRIAARQTEAQTCPANAHALTTP